MTRTELRKEADNKKKDIIDIIKQYYHKNETLQENLRKYNKFFGIPITEDDLQYIVGNKNIDIDKVISLNEPVSRWVCSKYHRTYTDVYKPLKKTFTGRLIPNNIKQQIIDMFDSKLNIQQNYNLYIQDENNYKLSYSSYSNIFRKHKQQRKPKLFFYV